MNCDRAIHARRLHPGVHVYLSRKEPKLNHDLCLRKWHPTIYHFKRLWFINALCVLSHCSYDF